MRAPVDGPYVFVGYSVGAQWARLYAARYPNNIVGMVIVDHAFIPGQVPRGKLHTRIVCRRATVRPRSFLKRQSLSTSRTM